MKRIASLLLALVMVLGLATTAFAADTTGSITVENPLADQSYTAYKIFDVTYDGDNYSYTIDADNNSWFETVQAYAKGENSGMTLTQINGTSIYNVTTTSNFSAGAFSSALNAAKAGKTGDALTVSGGKATVTGLELGYYFVTSTSGALCNLTTTDHEVTIRDKNDMPFEKTADDVSVEVGQTVNYKIEGKVPDTTGFSSYTYKVTDTMSEGLTFKKDVKVTINGTTVECNPVYTDNGFELTVPVTEHQNKVGTAILITYSATVNDKAVTVISQNEAVLEYTNNPDGSTTETPPEEVKVYSAKIVIDKYEANAEDTKLAGAKFILYKEADGVKSYYSYDATKKVVSWVADKSAATTVTTDANGAAEFIGLEDGTYYLEETEAPAGYNKLTAPVTVTISGSATDATKLTATSEVANNTGSELPETGGMGTTLFYAIGGILVLAAVVLLVTKRRMGSAE
ncbi:MAG: SpaH/EbpB family LPXTG-anchored major pilin [Oscillospiraceae bacterium]|nr:SpaH/EbpB family LPXTG-anchored major pilin [Oscillospiraceae bacterium]